MAPALDLTLLPGRLSVCRLPAGSELPAWATPGALVSLTWTAEETSVVCDESAVPEGVQAEDGWRAFAVAGPLDFSLTGVVSSLAQPLADAGIGIFVMSTFDTDYLLVGDDACERAASVLRAAGHRVV